MRRNLTKYRDDGEECGKRQRQRPPNSLAFLYRAICRKLHGSQYLDFKIQQGRNRRVSGTRRRDYLPEEVSGTCYNRRPVKIHFAYQNVKLTTKNMTTMILMMMTVYPLAAKYLVSKTPSVNNNGADDTRSCHNRNNAPLHLPSSTAPLGRISK